MRGKGLPIVSALVAVILLISVFVIVRYSDAETPQIGLPAETTGGPEASGEGANAGILESVEVNSGTIQSVVAALERPDSYSRSLRVRTYWDGGEAAFLVETCTYGGVYAARISRESGGDVTRLVITGDTVYRWREGSYTCFTYDRGESAAMADVDRYLMLLTYEDLLEIPEEDISGAGYVQFEGEYCLYAEAGSPNLGNRELYYISAESGLLAGYETYEGDRLVHRMVSGKVETFDESAGSEMMTLPDGTVLLPQAVPFF